MVRTYRKTATITAVQWTGANIAEVREHVGDTSRRQYDVVNGRKIYPPPVLFLGGYIVLIETMEGPLNVSPGYWIAKGPDGEVWPIADDTFQKSYVVDEPVTAD
jgi:hypothetical protein